MNADAMVAATTFLRAKRIKAASTQRFQELFTCLCNFLDVYEKSSLSRQPAVHSCLLIVARRPFMFCLLCGSGNQTELSAETVIHFSGLKNLDKCGVWVFPKLLVCLDCGCSHFTVPERQLASISQVIREDTLTNLPIR